MALTREEREARKKINDMLDRFHGFADMAIEEYQKSKVSKINEGTEPKVSTMKGLEQLLREYQDRLEYVGLESNSIQSAPVGGVNVSIFCMTNKNREVSEDDNTISISMTLQRDWRDNYVLVMGESSTRGTQIERFIGLPISSNHGDDAVSAEMLAAKCDEVAFYKLYLEDALALVRKHFPISYNMFVGQNMTKHKEYIVYDNKGNPRKNTLYVAYDGYRKKFRFSYNPQFILESAITEWMLGKDNYKSFKDCYCYFLAFSITHEMLHIVHHNTDTSDKGVDDSRLSAVAEHRVANIIMDSFINCKLSKGYRGASGLRRSGSLAPVLADGIGSKVSVRIQHNRGLKDFKTTGDLLNVLADTFLKFVGMEGIERRPDGSSSFDRDISHLAGADIFITIDVHSQLNEIRKGTNLFQTYINTTIMDITDGKAYTMYSELTDEEKAEDLNALSVGTLVMIKGMRDIGIVMSYNSDDDTYEINRADMTSVSHPDNDMSVCIPVYTDSGNRIGIFNRLSIRPYNPEDDAWREDVGQQKKDELTPEELEEIKKQMSGEDMPPMGGMPPMGPPEKPVKSLKVGDIVWVRKAKKFGRITSASNGKFSIEAVKEIPCKIIKEYDVMV